MLSSRSGFADYIFSPPLVTNGALFFATLVYNCSLLKSSNFLFIFFIGTIDFTEYFPYSSKVILSWELMEPLNELPRAAEVAAPFILCRQYYYYLIGLLM